MNKYDFVFISPHPDDIALSLPLTFRLLSQIGRTALVTVFTRSRFAHGKEVADDVSLKRQAEDLSYARRAHAEHIMIDLPDRSWIGLKKSNSSMRRARRDFRYVQFEKILRWLFGKETSCLCFAPLGIGSHLDHLIVQDVMSKVFCRVLYYEDLPYALFVSNEEKLKHARCTLGGRRMPFELRYSSMLWGRKINDLRIYPSQDLMRFADRLRKNSSTANNMIREGFWSNSDTVQDFLGCFGLNLGLS